jgi:hypothetical protein
MKWDGSRICKNVIADFIYLKYGRTGINAVMCNNLPTAAGRMNVIEVKEVN